jgi:hypothetical protein
MAIHSDDVVDDDPMAVSTPICSTPADEAKAKLFAQSFGNRAPALVIWITIYLLS